MDNNTISDMISSHMNVVTKAQQKNTISLRNQAAQIAFARLIKTKPHPQIFEASASAEIRKWLLYYERVSGEVDVMLTNTPTGTLYQIKECETCDICPICRERCSARTILMRLGDVVGELTKLCRHCENMIFSFKRMRVFSHVPRTKTI